MNKRKNKKLRSITFCFQHIKSSSDEGNKNSENRAPYYYHCRCISPIVHVVKYLACDLRLAKLIDSIGGGSMMVALRFFHLLSQNKRGKKNTPLFQQDAAGNWQQMSRSSVITALHN